MIVIDGNPIRDCNGTAIVNTAAVTGGGIIHNRASRHGYCSAIVVNAAVLVVLNGNITVEVCCCVGVIPNAAYHVICNGNICTSLDGQKIVVADTGSIIPIHRDICAAFNGDITDPRARLINPQTCIGISRRFYRRAGLNNRSTANVNTVTGSRVIVRNQGRGFIYF